MPAAICTLFEGDYGYGVGALTNSLAASGFEGVIWAGYRGALPKWARRAERLSEFVHEFVVTEHVAIKFVQLETDMHFTYYKPTFMVQVLNDLAPDASAVVYLDPDIVVKCAWASVAGWLDGGIALVEDINGYLPSRHPRRLLWRRLLKRRHISADRTLDYYYNGGFVGLPRAHHEFLELWQSLVEFVGEENSGLEQLKIGGPEAAFHSADQDALNMALMASEVAINGAGPEAMDFAAGGYHFSHAAGQTKPWRGGHLLSAAKGIPPSLACKEFYRFAHGPIPLFPASVLRYRLLSMRTSALIGRFYRRS